MSEFIEGTYEMVEIADGAWDKAFDGNYIFINEELASYNNIKINDTVKFEDESDNIYKFTVIGIYKENESNSSGPSGLFANSANTIITNADALIAITKAHSSINGSVDPTFIIDDYADKDKIQAEFYDKGLDESYTVETNEEVATAGLSSIKNVQSFATTFLIITLVIGGVVLFVINAINIRERKYEIGVLRTIGISKSKLTIQFVSELLIVGFVALLAGAGIGAAMSKDVSNSLLASEINSTKESSEQIKGNFGGPGGFGPIEGNRPAKDFTEKGRPRVEAYESIDAVVNVGVLLELLGIGLTLILISGLASMISIQRFTPLTILKERP
jgi:putative ABC transport system permease protein